MADKKDAGSYPEPEKGAITRTSLLKEASRILESEGYSALSLRSAAKAAGLSPAAPYRHFEHGFPEMLAVVAEDGFRALIEALGKAGKSTDSRERIVEVCLEYVRFGVERPELYRAMFSSLLARPVELREEMWRVGEISFSSRQSYEKLSAVKGEAFAALVHPLAEAQADGRVKAGDPAEFGLALAAMVHGLVGEFIDDGLGVRQSQKEAMSDVRRRMVRSVVELLLTGLDRGASPGAGKRSAKDP